MNEVVGELAGARFSRVRKLTKNFFGRAAKVGTSGMINHQETQDRWVSRNLGTMLAWSA